MKCTTCALVLIVALASCSQDVPGTMGQASDSSMVGEVKAKIRLKDVWIPLSKHGAPASLAIYCWKSPPASTKLEPVLYFAVWSNGDAVFRDASDNYRRGTISEGNLNGHLQSIYNRAASVDLPPPAYDASSWVLASSTGAEGSELRTCDGQLAQQVFLSPLMDLIKAEAFRQVDTSFQVSWATHARRSR